MSLYPAEITIDPWSGPPPGASVRVPGSKSLTNRALAIAAMADGPSRLTGALDSEDTRVMVAALKALGIAVVHDTETAQIRVVGCGGRIPVRQAGLDVANSGTSLRFLTAMLATGVGTYQLDGTSRMRQRPIADLLAALRDLGVRARSDLGTGCPPVTIEAPRPGRGFLHRARRRLQPVPQRSVDGESLCQRHGHGRGARCPRLSTVCLHDPGRDGSLRGQDRQPQVSPFRRLPRDYRGRDFAIEPDASAASYFFALAALTGGTIAVEGLGPSSLQGDLAFVDILEHMGCTVKRQPDRTTVTGGPLRAVDVDMNAISDTVMTMAVVALCADGVSRIRNVGHIRHKETDRIAALAAELRKLGARIDELADGLVIAPPASAMLQPARINTYDDHRMAMSFALAGLKFPGVTIVGPGCVAKTYPGFWNDLEAVRSSSGGTGF